MLSQLNHEARPATNDVPPAIIGAYVLLYIAHPHGRAKRAKITTEIHPHVNPGTVP